MFNPGSLPLTTAYFAGLPDGLDSYPECRVRTEVTQLILDRFPRVLDHPGIAPVFADRLRAALNQGEWMSEAMGIAVRTLARDSIFESDAAYDN